MPLEKGTSEGFRQREARAARLANEIEGSSQYRRRVSLENDEGKSEEEKYSAVVREREERERGSPGYGSSASRWLDAHTHTYIHAHTYTQTPRHRHTSTEQKCP